MRVLGLDPGMQRLGMSVIDVEDDTRALKLLYFGYFSHERVEQEFNKHLNTAILALTSMLPKVFYDFAPNKIAAEIVPVGRLKANTELVVAAITVCKVLACQWGIPWHDYGANSIKKEATGNGLATKAEVKNAMQELFPELTKAHVEEQKKQKAEGQKRAPGLMPDVYDSVAVALTGVRR